ncbi:MAG: sugar ABC transporter permease [Cyanobacteriota bacterium]
MKYIKWWVPYAFIIPAGVVLITFFFLPFIHSFYLTFFSYSNDIYNPEYVGIANYHKLFMSPEFYQALLNSIIYLIFAVPPLVFIPLVIAIIINQHLRGITLFRALIYIPVVISIVEAGIAWKWLYASSGPLNYLISCLGAKPLGYLTDPNIALFAVIVVTIWKGLGYYMVIYLASLSSVPQELYDAALTDGAGNLQKHLNVTIPHLAPAMALVSVISSISAMKVFVEIYVMTQGGPVNSTKTMVYYIYQKAFESLDFGYASCAGFVLLAITLIFSIINMKFLEKRYMGNMA